MIAFSGPSPVILATRRFDRILYDQSEGQPEIVTAEVVLRRTPKLGSSACEHFDPGLTNSPVAFSGLGHAHPRSHCETAYPRALPRSAVHGCTLDWSTESSR